MTSADAWDEDAWESRKDDMAIARIRENGTRREPDETDYLEQKAIREHEDAAHGGNPCDCPPPTKEEIDAQWAAEIDRHLAEDHGGGSCNCEAPF